MPVEQFATRSPTPYVGIRAYGFEDREIFTGRDSDIRRVCTFIAGRARWPLVLLHGQTGCGKSSFLKAGLVPAVTSSLSTTVFDRSNDHSFSCFVTSSADPMRRLAETAVELATSPKWPFADVEKADLWKCLTRDFGDKTSPAEAIDRLATAPNLLADWFHALAPVLTQPLLLIVDQAEEVFTLRVDSATEFARELYFDFLASCCRRRTWIQVLISMRTEFLGRFDNELRRRLGDEMPVAACYLDAFDVKALQRAATAPLSQEFREHSVAVKVSFEEGLPELIAHTVSDRFPGPGALTCLQLVCMRLFRAAVHDALYKPASSDGAVPALITKELFERQGDVGDTIEGIIDQAIGDFCDERHFTLNTSLHFARACKSALAELVTPQEDGAPTTCFIVRSDFAARLAKHSEKPLPKWVMLAMGQFSSLMSSSLGIVDLINSRRISAEVFDAFLTYAGRSDVRILREVQIVEGEDLRPVSYVALGHDVLSVGILEASSREASRLRLRQRETRRELSLLVGTGLGIPAVALAFIGALALIQHQRDSAWIDLRTAGAYTAVVTYFSMVCSFGIILAREFYTPKHRSWSKQLVAAVEEAFPRIAQAMPSTLTRLGRARIFKDVVYLSTRPQGTGRFLRLMTREDRQAMIATGASVFPGGARH